MNKFNNVLLCQPLKHPVTVISNYLIEMYMHVYSFATKAVDLLLKCTQET